MGDFATKSEPMTPAAPALFSTITGTSRRLASGPAMARAMTSLLPPAEKGTTILICFGIGAWAPTAGAKTTAAATQKRGRSDARSAAFRACRPMQPS